MTVFYIMSNIHSLDKFVSTILVKLICVLQKDRHGRPVEPVYEGYLRTNGASADLILELFLLESCEFHMPLCLAVNHSSSSVPILNHRCGITAVSAQTTLRTHLRAKKVNDKRPGQERDKNKAEYTVSPATTYICDGNQDNEGYPASTNHAGARSSRQRDERTARWECVEQIADKRYKGHRRAPDIHRGADHGDMVVEVRSSCPAYPEDRRDV